MRKSITTLLDLSIRWYYKVGNSKYDTLPSESFRVAKHVKCWAHVEQFPKPHPVCHILWLQYINVQLEVLTVYSACLITWLGNVFRLNSVLHISAGLATRRRGRRLEFDSRQGQEISPLPSASRPALKSTQSPIVLVPEALSSKVKWQGREANHSRPSSVEIKNGEAIHPLPHIIPSWHSS
jgi:hypothetical protein